METVSTDPGRLEPAGDRHDPGDPRHVVMERRVETGHLGHLGQSVPEPLDHGDLAGQVVGIHRADSPQLAQHVLADLLRPDVLRPPMHDAVGDPGDRRPADLPVQPVDQPAGRRLQVRGVDAGGLGLSAGRMLHNRLRLRQPDPFDPPLEERTRRGAGRQRKQGKLERRRPAVDREQAGSFGSGVHHRGRSRRASGREHRHGSPIGGDFMGVRASIMGSMAPYNRAGRCGPSGRPPGERLHRCRDGSGIERALIEALLGDNRVRDRGFDAYLGIEKGPDGDGERDGFLAAEPTRSRGCRRVSGEPDPTANPLGRDRSDPQASARRYPRNESRS